MLSHTLRIGAGIPLLATLTGVTGCTRATSPGNGGTNDRGDASTSTAPPLADGQTDDAIGTWATSEEGSFADETFRVLWATTDAGAGAHFQIWGPVPFTGGIVEEYREAPNGRRLVQYFDKARMELTSAGGPRTVGALPIELITGKQQNGDTAFLQRGPARVGVVGDPGNTFPTYADLAPFQTAEEDKTGRGEQIAKLLSPDGSTGLYAPALSDVAATVTVYDGQTKHNVPRAFADVRNDPVSGGMSAIGLAVTEPIWSNATVAGNVVPVLIQTFERRVLTYTPSNAHDFQVECANVGRSYFLWRYGALRAAATDYTSPIPQGTFVVTAYGAKGDGVTNDAPAIQAALDAAGEAGGGTVVFPPGTYQITATLIYRGNLTIQGTDSGIATIRNATTRGANQSMLLPRAPGVSNVRIVDLTFDQRADAYGEIPDQVLLSVDGTTNVAVTRCVFRNVQTVAIWCDSVNGIKTANHRVTQCRVTSSNGDGLSYFGHCAAFTIEANIIEHTKDDAIAVQDHGEGNYPQNVTISGNTIRDCTTASGLGSTANGINCFGGDRVQILNNTVSAVYANGIAVLEGSARRSTRVEVRGNLIDHPGAPTARKGVPGNGIYLNGADDVAGSGNRASNSRHAGLAIRRASGVTFTGDFTVSGLAGISIHESRDVTLTDCRVLNSGATPGSDQPFGLFLDGAGNGCDRIRVAHSRFGNDIGVGPQTQQYGLFCIGGRLTNIALIGNDFSSNLSASRNAIGPTSGQFQHNVGIRDWQ